MLALTYALAVPVYGMQVLTGTRVVAIFMPWYISY